MCEVQSQKKNPAKEDRKFVFFFFVDLFSVFPFFVFVTGCSGSLSGRVPFKAR